MHFIPNFVECYVDVSAFVIGLSFSLFSAPTESRQRVAFSALLRSHKTTTTHGKLILDQVLVNEGGAYNGKTGTFTCKVPGLYQFAWTISKNKGASSGLHMYLMKNNDLAFQDYVDEPNDNFSGSFMMYLQEGDFVWIKMIQAGGYLTASRHSAWSGLLL